jgi:hypothetical protein
LVIALDSLVVSGGKSGKKFNFNLEYFMKTSTKQILMVGALLLAAAFGSEAFAAGVSYLDATAVSAATDNITATVDHSKTATFTLLMLVTGTTVAFGLIKKFINIGAR